MILNVGLSLTILDSRLRGKDWWGAGISVGAGKTVGALERRVGWNDGPWVGLTASFWTVTLEQRRRIEHF